MISRQRTYQLRRQAEGKCMICGRPRGENGTSKFCRIHADQASQIESKRYQARKEQK